MISIPLFEDAPKHGPFDVDEFKVPRDELLALINDAISVAEGFRARTDCSLVDQQPCVPKALLAALLYCYVRGIYGSQQIEEAFKSDEELRLVAQCRPDRYMLREFRRTHREIIHQTLKHLQWFIRVKYNSPNHRPDSSSQRASRAGLSMKVESESAECFSRAAFVDQMMDD